MLEVGLAKSSGASKACAIGCGKGHKRGISGSSADPTLQSIRADINDEAVVAAAVAGAYGVVNAVSLYLERGTETFHALHVKAAERLARQAQRAGVERLVHVSGIGADAASSSLYIRSRGEGELAVQAAFANAIIIRPAVMFGPDDAFLNTLVTLLKRLSAYPLFGRGLTRLQPVSVEACFAAGRCASGHVRTWWSADLYILRGASQGGCGTAWEKAHLVFRAVSRMAFACTDAETLPGSALSRSQVDLLEVDTVAYAGMPGFGDLGIPAQPIEHTLEQILAEG